MIGSGLSLALGLALLLGGAEVLVRGASALARRTGVSPLIVGLTVVAVATSAPELAVNLKAALAGNPGISFGNIVGSNLANAGLVIGIAALLRPLQIENQVVQREIPMMLLVTLAALALGVDGGGARWSRADGAVLLLFLAIFAYYTGRDLLRGSTLEPAVYQRGETERERRELSGGLALGLMAIGVVGLVGGADLTVQGAMDLARIFGVSDALIGLTVIAVGTSLPELAASLVAVRRGQTEIAVGNVVGSNILNLLLVGGVCASVTPIPIPRGGLADLGVLVGMSALLWVLAVSHRNTIIRIEGAVLGLAYFGYITMRALGS